MKKYVEPKAQIVLGFDADCIMGSNDGLLLGWNNGWGDYLSGGNGND